MKKIYTVIVVAIMASLLTIFAFAEPYRIFGDCMEPAIKDGKFYFLNHVSPYLRQYQIGDVVLFKHNKKVWISRIVALEASTVQIIDGGIVLNGSSLQEPEIHRNWSNWRYGNYAIDNPLQIPKDHIFVLSDNLSAQHDDSRVFGPVPKESIIGLVW